MKMSEFEVGVWYTNPQLDKTYGAFDGGCGRDWAASVNSAGVFIWSSISHPQEKKPFSVSMSDITRDDWEPVGQPKEDLCAGESHMFVGVRCTGCGKEYASAIGNTIRSCPCGELYFTLFNHPKPKTSSRNRLFIDWRDHRNCIGDVVWVLHFTKDERGRSLPPYPPFVVSKRTAWAEIQRIREFLDFELVEDGESSRPKDIPWGDWEPVSSDLPKAWRDVAKRDAEPLLGNEQLIAGIAPKPDPCDEAWEKEWSNGKYEEEWFRRGFKAGRESK